MKKFKYPVSIIINSIQEGKEIFKELEQIGYRISDSLETSDNFPFIITNKYLSLGLASDLPLESKDEFNRFLCDSKELFLALASQVDSDEFFEGEYVYSEHCDYTNADHRSREFIPIFKLEQIYNPIETVWLRPSMDIPDGIDAKLCRKATKEEIIEHFSKNSILKEEKSDLIFGKWKVGEYLDLGETRFSYRHSNWEHTESNNKTVFPFKNTYKVIKEEIYNGESHLYFTTDYISGYFMIPKSELIKNGILTEEKTIKSQTENKMKEQFTVEGSIPLKKALVEELGYSTYSDSTLGTYNLKPNSEVKNQVMNKIGEFDKHYKLPEQYNEAKQAFLDYYKEELVIKIGKWYKIKNRTDVCVRATSKESGIGFTVESEWFETINFNDAKDWELAEEAEVKELLISEAKKRGFKEGVKVNNENIGYSVKSTISNGTFIYSDEDWLAISGIIIYAQGKWAEILPSTPEYVKIIDGGHHYSTHPGRFVINGLYPVNNKEVTVNQIYKVLQESTLNGKTILVLTDDKVTYWIEKEEMSNNYYREATKQEYENQVIVPDITINGYKAKFDDDLVGFGCNTIEVYFIKEVNRLQKLGVDLTKEADKIQQIVDYYNNK